MLHRIPAKSSLWRLPVKIFVVTEVVAAATTYVLWRETNRDQEFRFNLATSKSTVSHAWLDFYYKMGEMANKDLKIREKDLELWRQQGRMD